MLTFKEFLHVDEVPLLEGELLSVYDAILPILLVNEDGPPPVPNLGIQPTPPTTGWGVSGPSGWGKGPFNPSPWRPDRTGFNGNKWANELYVSVKSYAVATRMSDRMKSLGLSGAGVDRVNNAKKTALKNTKDLITNPFATAYKIPTWTTKNTMPKIAIKMWNECFAREFARELSKIVL